MLWGRENVDVPCGIATALDGYAAVKGHPAPKSRREGRAVAGRHLPHLADLCGELYGLSLEGRYYDGCSMTEKSWRKAERCREARTRSIPAQERAAGLVRPAR